MSTKIELTAQLAEVEAELATVQSANADLQREVEVATAEASVVVAERDSLVQIIEVTDRRLGEIHDTVNEARIAATDNEEVWQSVSEAVNQDVRELFARLLFAASTLSTVITYGGPNPELPRKLARAALEELEGFVTEAQDVDAYENVFLTNLNELYGEEEECTCGASDQALADALGVPVARLDTPIADLTEEQLEAIFGDVGQYSIVPT